MKRQLSCATTGVEARRGKIRHLPAKSLWVQKKVMAHGQVLIASNCNDIGAKSLAKARMFLLMNQMGAISAGEPLGQEEFKEASRKTLCPQGHCSNGICRGP